MPVVDHDCIIYFQTLEWKTLDIESVFDLAAHTDYDVHVSILYDVGDAEPLGFSGMRVGYPADRDARIGMITPPSSPRRFAEDTLTGHSIEGGLKFVGSTYVAHHESALGVQNRVYLKNNTALTYVETADSPVLSDDEIFDANAMYDAVPHLLRAVQTGHQLGLSVMDQFDLGSDVTLRDDLVVDYLANRVHGNIYISYDISQMHISEIHVEPEGWSPEIDVYGLDTVANAKSPATIAVSYTSPTRNLVPMIRRSGLNIRILCNPLRVSPAGMNYGWVTRSYALNGQNWRIDAAGTLGLMPVSWAASLSICSRPTKAVAVRRSVSDETVLRAHSSTAHMISSFCSPYRSFGSVRSLSSTETVGRIYANTYTCQSLLSSFCQIMGSKVSGLSIADRIITTMSTAVASSVRMHSGMASWH